MTDESNEQHGLLTPGQRRYLRGEGAHSAPNASQHRSGIQARLECLGGDLALIASAYDADRVEAALSDHPVPAFAVKMLLDYGDGVEAQHALSEYVADELRAIEREVGDIAETVEEWEQPHGGDDA